MLFLFIALFRFFPAEVLHKRVDVENHQQNEQHPANDGQYRQGLNGFFGRDEDSFRDETMSVFPLARAEVLFLDFQGNITV